MRKSTVFLAGGLFLFANSSLWLLMRLNEARARYAELRAQTANRRIIDAPTGQSAGLVIINAPPLTPVAQPSTISDTETRAKKKPAAAEDWRERERHMLKDPRVREATKAQRRLEMQSWRDESMRLLGLTAGQADKVIDLYIERELDESLRPNPQNADEGKQRMREIEAAEYQRDDVLAEILGDAKAAEWQQYVRSQPSRAEVRELGAQLLSTAQPLRDDQVEPLVSALSTERERVAKEMNDYYLSLDWDESSKSQSESQYAKFVQEHLAAAEDRGRRAAAGILSQQQLDAFVALRQQKAELAQAQRRIFRTRSEANQAEAGKRD